MRLVRLADMTRGWFVGDFEPSALRTAQCEVALKHYRAGDREEAHLHRIATEITLVVSGQVRMCGQVFTAGDIVVLDPGEVTSFEALADAACVVVKHPGAKDDKVPAPS